MFIPNPLPMNSPYAIPHTTTFLISSLPKQPSSHLIILRLMLTWHAFPAKRPCVKHIWTGTFKVLISRTAFFSWNSQQMYNLVVGARGLPLDFQSHLPKQSLTPPGTRRTNATPYLPPGVLNSAGHFFLSQLFLPLKQQLPRNKEKGWIFRKQLPRRHDQDWLLEFIFQLNTLEPCSLRLLALVTTAFPPWATQIKET